MKNFAIAALVFFTGCATSSHKVTGLLRPAISPDDVKVYSVMPANAQTVGVVKADSYAGITMEQATDDALAKLKSEAAKLGANAIVVQIVDAKVLDGAELQGQAVFVSP